MLMEAAAALCRSPSNTLSSQQPIRGEAIARRSFFPTYFLCGMDALGGSEKGGAGDDSLIGLHNV